ncbi:2OG-Fe(II) oxygenase family oxidoreductase [Biscogniauxia sp. FL1348]|nr:2OG-Fe(II) oxygenase family oxidoreductase [Biscogniauxia sp. FL1348]
MFSVVVGGIAFLLVFYNPIVQYLSRGEPTRLPRTPRPRINESLLAIDAANETLSLANCPPDAYAVHILSKAPLVIYVENFISEDERAHLLEISEPLFEPSTITNDGDSTVRNATIRDSEVALIPRTDVVRCVEARAKAFQGWRDDLWIERLRTQRYGIDQHYAHHFDWGSGARGWGRVSSFMVWVRADDVKGGGTEFPLLPRNGPDEPWCRWVECAGEQSSEVEDEGEEEDSDSGGAAKKEKKKKKKKDGEPLTGVTFVPVAGNAVFWENFRPDGTGRGWEETWHAGLPIKRGIKVGLNIWSWGRLS